MKKKKIKEFTFQPTFLTFNNELGQILKMFENNNLLFSTFNTGIIL